MSRFVYAIILGSLLVSPVLSATYGGGRGQPDNPYQIWTAEQMNTIGANPKDWVYYFKLMADIDMSAYSGTQYHIIGSSTLSAFTGAFDGNGHVIRNLTYTTAQAVNNVGLFGVTMNAAIQNLGLENVAISSGGSNIGGLVGMYGLVGDGGSLTSCYATGSVSGTGDSSLNVGGLVGVNNASLIACHSSVSTSQGSAIGGLVGNNYAGGLTGCYATGSVSGFGSVGGLVGSNSGGLTGCYATGSVSGTGESSYVGGLVGENTASVASTITSCYATGSVSGTGDYCMVGGLVGINAFGSSLTACYATGPVSGTFYIGGLLGLNDGVVTACYSSGSVAGTSEFSTVGGLVGDADWGYYTACFWDTQTSGQSNGIGYGHFSDSVIGKTTAEMKTRSTFTDAGWDFVGESDNGTADIWRMCANDVDYPHLSWEFSQGGDFDCPDGVATEDLLYLASRWLATTPETIGSADLTSDGKVDLSDLAILSQNWLK